MNSLAERKPLSVEIDAARAIVQTDDPKLLELASRMLQIDSYHLCEMKAAARGVIEKKTQELQEALAEDVAVDLIAGKILLERIKASGGHAIPHERFKVEIKADQKIDRRIDVLRQLEGKVPDDELAPALYLKHTDPEWKADAAKLRALVRKYGPDSEIGQIINDGLVYYYGEPRLVFEPREPQIKAVR